MGYPVREKIHDFILTEMAQGKNSRKAYFPLLQNMLKPNGRRGGPSPPGETLAGMMHRSLQIHRSPGRLGIGLLVALLMAIGGLFLYLRAGGLYQIVPLADCRVCAYKINKITGRTWYLVRDQAFPVKPGSGPASQDWILNPHTGELEPR